MQHLYKHESTTTIKVMIENHGSTATIKVITKNQRRIVENPQQVELVQVQLTRFTCDSLVVGFTAHHLVADGHSTSNFLVAWSQACCGLNISPLPLHDCAIFSPRDPPLLEFEHRGVEFLSKKLKKDYPLIDNIMEDIVVHKVHFTLEFLAKLKLKASSMNGGNNIPYSTFESLVAHLWRAITKTRALSGFETTHIRISVNGRMRLNPRIPNEYFGNMVLWAFPIAKVKDLLREPLPYATKLIHDAVTKVTYNTHIAVIYAYCPPTPPNVTLEVGLQKALSVYREWGGRLGRDEKGDPVILLNDEGVRFVEASVDSTLDEAIPFKPSASLLSLHPSLKGVVELVQVQLTRFTCGSLVVGFTAHHLVADGHSTSNFLVAWGQACRGLNISPLPLHDRAIFSPRDPPLFEFEHRGVEFMSKKLKKDYPPIDNIMEDIVVHKVHFTLEFLAKLKAKASSMNGGNNIPYSTFESLVAHLWRAITKARALSGFETTHIRISVNGRMRLNPRIPNEYFGNMVLWAFPTAKVKDLLREPLPYATKLIHDAVTKVNNNYFKSFIDFANHKVEGEEDLIPTADMNKSVLCPNLEVDSWLRFPFYDLDFGGGCPYIFMPSYFPTEGMMFLLPSFIGDGSIDAFIPVFQDNLASFKQICYCLSW
ncbi:hypothetical protein F0562_001945 [Nyssa sinensis]|uniref:Uncharacterized protein n=1 Tax=Nyssa sinensis TaxID=561372 RepID=A0A5J5C9G3_9ASTE|nr:hypothetical protein F0562_001945 [Nyssa sinensis]